MNKLIFSDDINVTSLDIARVTNKKHSHVLRDVREEINSLGQVIGESIFGFTSYKDKQGTDRPCYSFGKKGAMQLALKYDAKTRFRVINYIEELEEKNKPTSIEDLIIMQAESVKELKGEVKEIKSNQENITKIISLRNEKDWRDDTNKIINTIARMNGGTYRQTRQESYSRLETRARCDLQRRLENKIERMKKSGVPKRTLTNLNYLDVIADDDRLIEIYLAIVREMAVEHNIGKAI